MPSQPSESPYHDGSDTREVICKGDLKRRRDAESGRKDTAQKRSRAGQI